ncbi:hypothetical protein ORI20_31225 [Mycobacterium sp. CVI_P3]|uniref:Uncharacterized protein n=1 Tax=Mycobacterium pinniadriaticum TaxID=2994102 RepID=A0ABT3SNS3_9MYCO|nr:hypothetical protein [Mycobacterium pinniadriaticum]MCX2934739.1 hypothetical protein [Mycobacterium pinniadriaticum]MCX2941161.1 hypothetical protein [Mycobacterium pinniadriaticum]
MLMTAEASERLDPSLYRGELSRFLDPEQIFLDRWRVFLPIVEETVAEHAELVRFLCPPSAL